MKNPRPVYKKDRLRDDGLWQWKVYNDRLWELEQMMPYIEKNGFDWTFIGHPKIAPDNQDILYWFVGIQPARLHHSVASQIPMGWYTLGEIMEGKPYDDAFERGKDLNKKEDAKHMKKYHFIHPEKKPKKKKRTSK